MTDRTPADDTPPRLPLEQRLAEAMDPSGQTRALVQGFEALTAIPALAAMLRSTGMDVDSMANAGTQFKSLHGHAVQAIRVFAPIGWAPSDRMPLDAYVTAFEVLKTHGDAAAEQVLVEAWDDEHRLMWPVRQISGFGRPETDYNDLFRRRSHLLAKAYDHHRAGAYEASIPILLAQIEGFVADVTGGKMFFSRHPKKAADVIDATAIATQDEALPVVREFFSQGMDYTARTGSLSRHGILHGRELGYDTRVNSVKAFVLLQALVEWAQPLVEAETERRTAAREAHWSGSEEVDEQGRRRDAREFAATRSALRWLSTCQMGAHNNTGHYRDDLVPVVEPHFVQDGLPTDHGIELRVRPDRQAWWAWRRTISGWYLGIGAVGPTPSQWYYDAPTPPASGPDDDPEAWGGDEFALLPNWSPG